MVGGGFVNMSLYPHFILRVTRFDGVCGLLGKLRLGRKYVVSIHGIPAFGYVENDRRVKTVPFCFIVTRRSVILFDLKIYNSFAFH